MVVSYSLMIGVVYSKNVSTIQHMGGCNAHNFPLSFELECGSCGEWTETGEARRKYIRVSKKVAENLLPIPTPKYVVNDRA